MSRFAKKSVSAQMKVAASLCALLAMCGCMHDRFVVATDVPPRPVGEVRTRYRYTIHEGGLDYQLWLKGSNHARQHKYFDFSKNSDYSKTCPDVFIDDGIPIVVESRDTKNETWDPFGYRSSVATSENVPKRLMYLLCLGLVPATYGNESETRYTIRFLTGSSASDSFMGFKREDTCFSPAFYMGPYPLLFYNGVPDMNGFDAQTIRKEDSSGIGSGGCLGILKKSALEREVIALAVASKLKRMEDAGQITEAMWYQVLEARKTRNANIAEIASKRMGDEMARRLAGQIQQTSTAQKHPQSIQVVREIVREPKPQKPEYSLESLMWDKDSDYACSFVIKMNGECSLDTFFEVQESVERKIRNGYCRNHRNANRESLVVDVRPNLEDGLITGRAVVLTISIASGHYDANTRCGKLAVKFNAGQAEEARAWIRKNIETLARDKNIALTAGQLPPAATYYSLGEKIDGNVMEIEFKTE